MVRISKKRIVYSTTYPSGVGNDGDYLRSLQRLGQPAQRMVLPQGQAGGVNGAEGIFVHAGKIEPERAKPFFSKYFTTIFDGHGQKTSRC